MNGYIALFNGKTLEIQAKDLYSAKLLAISLFKPKKSDLWKVSVHLCELADGSQVTHTPN